MKKLLLFLTLTLLVFIIKIQSAVSFDTVGKAGDAGALAVPVTAGILTLIYNDKEGTTQLVESYAMTTALTYGLKYAVNEERPNGGKHSFPSFHTASAFAGAAFVHQRYGLQYGLPLYLASSFVGYSRIESREHYFRDVIAGAAIGVASNLLITRPFKALIVTPVVGKGFEGVMIGKSF